MPGSPPEVSVLPEVASGAGILCFFGLVSYGSWRRPSWGRIPGVVCCILALFLVPIGTAIGVLGLIAYGRGRDLFGPNRYLHGMLDAEWKYRRRHGVA